MAVYPIYVAPTPYNAVELDALDHAQSFDTIYLAHEYYAPGKLVRTDHASWSYASVGFGPAIDAPTGVTATATVVNIDDENDGANYFPQDYRYIVSAVNSDDQESRGSAPDTASNDTELPRNYTTITWTPPGGSVEYYRVYKAHESGSFGFIGESTTATFTDDGYQPDYSDAPIEAYSPFGATGDYPGRVGFWEQRLWLARTTNAPNGLWASRSADFENMDYARPQRENDSITMAIATGQSNTVEGFIPMERLLVGTSDNIFALRGANDDILVPNPPPGARKHVGRGIALPKPIIIGEVAFYQPRVETGVRSLGFTFEIDGYKSSDVSIFAPHLFEQYRIKRWAYQAEPHSILWVVRDDGLLLALTWEAEQQVWGWTEMDLGGIVLDVVCIPEGPESRIYLTVERVINGETVRYVEQLDRSKWADYKISAFVDSARLYLFDTPMTTIQGLQHLEGELVNVLADGYFTTATVSGGEIELADAASKVVVGLPYDALIETLPLPDEPKKKITGEIYLEMVESFDVYAGRREDELELVRTRVEGEIGPPILFTGQAEPARPDQVVDHEATIIVRQSSPYPMTITALHYGVESK